MPCVSFSHESSVTYAYELHCTLTLDPTQYSSWVTLFETELAHRVGIC
jgi:hypothetical protein